MTRIAVLLLGISVLSFSEGRSHCDTMNGPVVKAGQRALESKDLRLALIWVQPADEPEIRSAFEKALAVRALGGNAKELADRYFFETLVRVHRAREGAPFTGLKEADVQPEPGIAAAEHALEAGSLKELSAELTATLHARLKESFEQVEHSKTFNPGDVAAGRRYVAHYVNYIHLVERLHNAVSSSGESHGTEEHDH